MKKKIFNKISIILLCLLCLNTVIPMAAERVELKNSTPHDIYTACLEEGMNVDAKSAILIEPVTGTVLYEKNTDEKFAPASVTKIMTMLLAMEAIDSGKISLDDKITCSENAKSMGGSTMLLDTGEVRTVEDILKGIAIASALELLKHPTILKYSGTYMETISEGRKSPIELVNHNKLVRFFDGCDGLKTGFTQEAKYCISATAVRNGVRMLAVIMGAPTYKIRNRDASMLMNYGFSKYEGKKLFNKDDDVETIYLGKNTERYFIAKAKDDLFIVVLKGSDGEPINKIVLDEEKDSYSEGETIGKCEVYLNEQKIGEVELYCDRDVEKGGFFDNLKYNMKSLFKKGV